MKLNTLLKERAKKAGISHSKISKNTGIERENVTRMLNHNCKLDTFEKLCNAVDGNILKEFEKILNE